MTRSPCPTQTIFLYGPPATGKSSCARMLANALGKALIDIDALIVQEQSISIPEIFKQFGEARFREYETACIRSVCDTHPNAVVALGGGALLRDENRTIVEATGPVICLMAPIDVLADRASRKPNSRPLAESRDHFQKLLDQRQAHYNSFSIKVNNGRNTSLRETCHNIQIALGTFRVSGMGDPYFVQMGPGIYDSLPAILEQLSPQPNRILIVGDSNTLPLYGKIVADKIPADYTVSQFEILAGEPNKTLATVSTIWDKLATETLTRQDLIIALGGGIVGDLTGFAAATWLRGVRWINLPTSLLAMVDAGIGGKTGADLPIGKNLIGAFHPPCVVLADTQTLSTLPQREILCGLAESYKHALISDGTLHKLLLNLAPQRPYPLTLLSTMAKRSAAVKIKTICQDPYEKTGVRAALNLGHTIGHAIEIAADFSLLHGEAVAIGILAAAWIAKETNTCSPTLVQHIEHDLKVLGLPTRIPASVDLDKLYQAMLHDKKNVAGAVKFVLPKELAKVKTGITISPELYQSVIHKLLR